MLDLAIRIAAGWSAGAVVALIGLPFVAQPRTTADRIQLGLASLLWPITLVMCLRAHLRGQL